MRYPGGGNDEGGVSSQGQAGTGKDGEGGGPGGIGGSSKAKYSIPGILHFIQHEWARFEMERASWELEKAELAARIAFLQGERKGQENLKNDLVRRIKMLEYALKQERAKFHKLKFGKDPPGSEMQVVEGEEGSLGGQDIVEGSDGDEPISSQVSWRQGRQLLRQYLQEIGYTDTIIDVRSNRVRSLLGLEGGSGNGEGGQTENGGGGGEKRASTNSQDGVGRRSAPPPKKSLAEAMMMEAETAVLANFDFLTRGMDVDDDDDMVDDLDDVDDDAKHAKRIKAGGGNNDEVDAETEEVLNEFSFLGSEDVVRGGGDSQEMMGDSDSSWNYSRVARQSYNSSGGSVGGGGGGSGVGQTDDVSLGELAQLTVNNDADVNMDVTLDKDSFRKTWMAKYTLRSHFDCVRALAFHPVEPVLVTASEDHTLKMWNLHKTVSAKKNASLDVEPLYTFRAHSGPVLCLRMSSNGENMYSGSLDGTVNVWTLPNVNIDPYDSYDPSVSKRTLTEHTDAVHGLSLHVQKPQLLSVSADGSIKLWDVQAKTPLLQSYVSESDGIPAAVDFVRDEPAHMVASYGSGVVVWDLETATALVRFETEGLGAVNRLVCHPTLSLTITAHEDRQIRFWDNSTGKMLHAMVAHLDAVTSLALDPHGLYLLSGSHDCSVRIWNVESKQCLQEMTAHRKKFDEAIHDVAFHPSKPFIASAGADGLAKVYV